MLQGMDCAMLCDELLMGGVWSQSGSCSCKHLHSTFMALSVADDNTLYELAPLLHLSVKASDLGSACRQLPHQAGLWAWNLSEHD